MSHAEAAILEAKPVTEEVLTPKQFIGLKKEDKAKIKSTSIVPPALGEKGFGGIKVKYKTTIYKVG